MHRVFPALIVRDQYFGINLHLILKVPSLAGRLMVARCNIANMPVSSAEASQHPNKLRLLETAREFFAEVENL